MTKGKFREALEKVDWMIATITIDELLKEAKKEFPLSSWGWFSETEVTETREWFEKWYGEREE